MQNSIMTKFNSSRESFGLEVELWIKMKRSIDKPEIKHLVVHLKQNFFVIFKTDSTDAYNGFFDFIRTMIRLNRHAT